MILPSVSEIRESERYTMQNEPIASIDLMERAAAHFTSRLCEVFDLSRFEEIVVFCGPGNNGGDGLVVARLLAQQEYKVTVVLCHENAKTTEEFETNRQRLPQCGNLKIVPFSQYKPLESEKLLIIDALFGIGLSRPLEGYFADAVKAINALQGCVVAVDCPSGLFLEQHTPKENVCVEADFTFTFQFAKEAFLFPENEGRVGEFEVIDIGLQLPSSTTRKGMITLDWAKHHLQWPRKFAHKGDFGFGLVIAGSYDMPGAAVMAAKAAMRGGIGKVMVHSVKRVTDILPIALPEAILHTDENEQSISSIDIERLSGINAIAVGPGIGKCQRTVSMVKNLIDDVRSPMIFDADALNILSENKTWLAYLPPYSILTPHRKEFERLAGRSANDFELRDNLVRFAQRYSVIVVLKGAHTAIAFPDGSVRYNTTGNPGMATAGSGDVLTGLLLALLAQGYEPTIAVQLGVFLHGLAGDEALNKQSEQSLIATDIVESLGEAYKRIR